MLRKVTQVVIGQSIQVSFLSLVLVATLVLWTYRTEIFSNQVQCKEQQATSESKETARHLMSLCNCKNKKTIAKKFIKTGTNVFEWCSPESSSRGLGQKVIAYTLYGNIHNSSVAKRYYSPLILRNISLTAEKLYPGWIVRIYHNITDGDGKEKEEHKQLCDIYCEFPNVDLCSVPIMVSSLGKETIPIHPDLLSGLNPKMFRYLAMLDENVDVFISRDIDSVIWPREVDAVEEWLKSNFTFHAMRDHDFHATIILAGMWGAKLYKRRDLITGLTRALVASGQDQFAGQDQSSLVSIVWPVAKYDVMVHDSYHCENENLTRESPLKIFPFPTQRNGNYYVGGLGGELYPWECPEACRPSLHKDWEFC